jgi:hypothetical protein
MVQMRDDFSVKEVPLWMHPAHSHHWQYVVGSELLRLLASRYIESA